LPASVREALVAAISSAKVEGMSFEAACASLELNPRAVYRWKEKKGTVHHGGGGGRNKITPLEEKRVVALAKKFPALKCRRLAYELERKSLVFVGKTKVSEILLKHGLNHEFIQGKKKELIPPGELLLHEPWKPNLLWGMDWTYLRVGNCFWFLLVIVDWYSRKIVAWGLFPQITRFEVVATVTDAVANESIDLLPSGDLRPRLVADHGSANIAAYTRANIEVQGLELWLSGIGRPTGNARTERTIGTLKREEIHLQEEYIDEKEARERITNAIWDYNFRRPNAGNGGFAPSSVHLVGRKILLDRRKTARQITLRKRINFWDQERPC
jgi:putative transposase